VSPQEFYDIMAIVTGYPSRCPDLFKMMGAVISHVGLDEFKRNVLINTTSLPISSPGFANNATALATATTTATEVKKDVKVAIEEDPDENLILPTAPTDIEKLMYLDAKKTWLYCYSVVSFFALSAGMWLFILSNYYFMFFAPFVLLTMVYLSISYFPILASKPYDHQTHLKVVAKGFPSDLPSVDILLPCCGEPLKVLENTYRHVRQLKWPGANLKVWVLDDGHKDTVRDLAGRYGFEYVRRDDRPHLKKAGNLRNAFKITNGDFFVIYDADFCPRPDFLLETIPHMLHDPKIAIIQTPQFFRVLDEQTWVEKGAGLIQELFYRLIQPGRNHYGASICVGTSALYRRKALEPFGGTAPIEHSEDVMTGFTCVSSGWRIFYLPLNLSMGVCPSDMRSFFNQQYRWGSGSTTLMLNKKFWSSSLSWMQKTCYFSGMMYYSATALSIFLNPMPGISLLLFNPELIKWFNIGFAIPSLIGSTLVAFFWSKQKYGLFVNKVRIIQYYAHLYAVKDKLLNTQVGWIPTGGKATKSKSRFDSAKSLMIVWTCLTTALVLGGSVWRSFLIPWYHLVPLVLLTVFDFVMHIDWMFGRENHK
jgi:cellulose synthase/poly-beta-1,6-N-acetylglucosamine synthase-like glycosyltransferase